MQPELAFVLTAGLYAVPGLGILVGLRVVAPTPTGTLAALGLAYMVGLSSVLLTGIALLCVGVGVRTSTLAFVAVLITSGGLAARRFAPGRRTRRRLPRRPPTVPHPLAAARNWTAAMWLVALTLFVLSVYALVGFVAVQHQPLTEWDAWSIWARKALLLSQMDGLPTAFLTSPHYAFMHPDYPLLLPLFEAVWFRTVGSADVQTLHGQFWILLIGFAWAAGFVASKMARAAVWLPVVAMIVVTPAVSTQLLTLYADVPLGLFLGLGLLLGGSWLAHGRGADLVLSTLMLAAAANTKNEGLVAAGATLVVLLGVAMVKPLHPRGHWRGGLAPMVALIGFAVAIAPWRLWLAAHDIEGDMSLGKGLDPGYLIDRADRVWPSIEAIEGQVSAQGQWWYLLPLGMAVVLASLCMRRARRIAAFYGLTGLTVFASLVWAYWISPNDLSWHLGTSVNRVVVSLMFVAVAALLQLTDALLTDPSGPAGQTAETGRAPARRGSVVERRSDVWPDRST